MTLNSQLNVTWAATWHSKLQLSDICMYILVRFKILILMASQMNVLICIAMQVKVNSIEFLIMSLALLISTGEFSAK